MAQRGKNVLQAPRLLGVDKQDATAGGFFRMRNALYHHWLAAQWVACNRGIQGISKWITSQDTDGETSILRSLLGGPGDESSKVVKVGRLDLVLAGPLRGHTTAFTRCRHHRDARGNLHSAKYTA